MSVQINLIYINHILINFQYFSMFKLSAISGIHATGQTLISTDRH